MTDLALSALTDVILACLFFFLSGLAFRPGLSPRSAAFAFAVQLFCAGWAAMLGAINHAFLEPVGHPLHAPVTALSWAVMMLGAVLLVVVAARAYLPRRPRAVLVGAAVLAGLAAGAAGIALGNLWIVLVPQAVMSLVVLALAARAALGGRGSALFTLGIALLIVSNVLPPAGVAIAGLGLYGTFHVAIMVSALVAFLGRGHLPAVPRD